MSRLLEVTPEVAIEELRSQKSLTKERVLGVLDISRITNPSNSQQNLPLDVPVRISNCHIEHLVIGAISANELVTLVDSTFGEVDFLGFYFFYGIEIHRCEFKGPVRVLWGGHNEHGRVYIADSVFYDFVDFEDCMFMGPVHLRNVEFRKGTNLLGMQGQPYQVTFAEAPILENVQGELRSDSHSTGGK